MIICYCDLAEFCDNPEHNEEVIYFEDEIEKETN